MKTRTSFKRISIMTGLSLSLCAQLLISCSKNPDRPQNIQSPPSQANQPPHQQVQPSANMGGVATGGGYYDKNGNKLLTNVSNLLSAQVRRASVGIFDGLLPSTFSKDDLAQAIENVKTMPLEERQRNGTLLVFDYDKQKRLLIALKPFFYQYGMAPEGSVSPDVLKDLKIKLLHEAAHLAGIGIDDDDEAEKFAKTVYSRMEKDIAVCGYVGEKNLETLFTVINLQNSIVGWLDSNNETHATNPQALEILTKEVVKAWRFRVEAIFWSTKTSAVADGLRFEAEGGPVDKGLRQITIDRKTGRLIAEWVSDGQVSVRQAPCYFYFRQ